MSTKARFRIRTRDGRDLEPRTLEVLAELVRSGAVGPDDLVFDAVTSEWAPARTHTVVRMFSDGGELPAGPVDRAPEDGGESAGRPFGTFVVSPDPDAPADLDLDLVRPDAPTPQEEAATFIARMEEERRRDPETPEAFRDGRVGPDEPRVFRGLASPGRARRRTSSAIPRPAGESSPTAASQEPPSRRRRRGRLRSQWAVAAVVPVGAVLVAAAIVRSPGTEASSIVPSEAVAAVPRAPRPVSGSEARLRETAYGRFVDAVDALRVQYDIDEVPPQWLEGRYLADAVSYPEVRVFWERFLSYAEEAYASEVELYRRAYLGVSEEAGVAGPVRSLRLASAVEDFEVTRRTREIHYARAWDLAHSALALHDQLVHLRGRITYEPARGHRVSADPVIEAAGTDAEAQSRLEASLDRVLRDLRGGVRGADDVQARVALARWLADGLRGVVAETP